MGIYIKGMEMPTSCDKCIYSAWSNFYQIYVCNAVRKNEPVLFDGKQTQTKSTACVRSARADNCPLIPVPPHGRLIDADMFQRRMYERNFDGRMSENWLALVNLFLAKAPAVIPAEEPTHSNASNTLNALMEEGE